MGPTLSAHELAAELGRSADWLYANWQRLRKAERMPAPLHGGEKPLTWSRAQIMAWIDRDLPKPEKVAAAAFRAAAAAAAGQVLTGTTALEEDAWRDRLDRQFASQGGEQ